MYVCLCNAVTDRQIRTEIRQGACTVRDLRKRLGIASYCGRCLPCARSILAESAMITQQQNMILDSDEEILPFTA